MRLSKWKFSPVNKAADFWGKETSMSDIILYTTEDGATKIDRRSEDGTVWLSQQQIADLFQATKQNISLHLKNIFEDGELSPAATVKESLTVQKQAKKESRKQGGKHE
jgi:hypothetical protein